jgi:hypothetical protein
LPIYLYIFCYIERNKIITSGYNNSPTAAHVWETAKSRRIGLYSGADKTKYDQALQDLRKKAEDKDHMHRDQEAHLQEMLRDA